MFSDEQKIILESIEEKIKNGFEEYDFENDIDFDSFSEKKKIGEEKNEKDVSNINVCSRNANSNCSRLFKNIVVGYYLLVSQI